MLFVVVVVVAATVIDAVVFMLRAVHLKHIHKSNKSLIKNNTFI